ncbi:MAG TPA: methyltransferase domain-containing protein, partial [Gemmatimonadales bacterium]|nr:methyltransferase domain-containing protein [Gemmatimonadales bacterium]
MTITAPAVSPVGTELLDDPAADPAAVAESLRHIARANYWFGGRAAVRYGMAQLCERWRADRPLTLVDVGTGLGDLPRDLVRWGEKRGLRVVPLGIERSRVAAGLAARHGVPMVVGCAGSLPLARHSVDVVLASQVAHHFSAAAAARFFVELSRVARFGVVVADLRRSPLAESLFRLGSRLLQFDESTRADGVTSIRRGYTREELHALIRRSGRRAHVRRR